MSALRPALGRPVYLCRAGDVSRPDGAFAQANSAGQSFFTSRGVVVDAATGRLSATPEQARGHLKAVDMAMAIDELRETYANNA